MNFSVSRDTSRMHIRERNALYIRASRRGAHLQRIEEKKTREIVKKEAEDCTHAGYQCKCASSGATKVVALRRLLSSAVYVQCN